MKTLPIDLITYQKLQSLCGKILASRGIPPSRIDPLDLTHSVIIFLNPQTPRIKFNLAAAAAHRIISTTQAPVQIPSPRDAKYLKTNFSKSQALGAKSYNHPTPESAYDTHDKSPTPAEILITKETIFTLEASLAHQLINSFEKNFVRFPRHLSTPRKRNTAREEISQALQEISSI